MGTIVQKLQNIVNSKADIKAAIEEKGVTVGDTVLSEYGDKIREIQLTRDTSTTSNNYCIGRWQPWYISINTAVRVDGDVDLALDWYPCLIDMTPVEGETKKRPVGWLKRNNWLRFEDDSFAPTVGITETQRAECDVALYFDDQASDLYCNAGEFDAESFYNTYGMNTPLYNASGNSVRILRPWETTETKYSIFVTRKDTVYLIDGEDGSDGLTMNGIIADEGKVDGIKGTHKLVPTGIAAGPCTELNGKIRCFYFDYCTNEVGCKGITPRNNLTGTGDLFFNDGTYPRVLDLEIEGGDGLYPQDDGKGINQAKNAQIARACNYDTTKPYPIAEGGWHAWNTFITSLSVAYGCNQICSLFGYGIGLSTVSNETTYLQNAGIRYKTSTATSWTYASITSITNIYYNESASRESIILTLNRDGPKMYCLEAQMALSMAAELGIGVDTDFEFYGKTYFYRNCIGTTSLLSGRMNAKLYRKRSMTLNAYNASKVATTFDIETIMQTPIAEGVNISGDHYVYMGGGHEVVLTNENGIYLVKSYLECDQTKWKNINHNVDQVQDYDFMSDYERLTDGLVINSNYSMKRCNYGTWKHGGCSSVEVGACAYHHEANLSAIRLHKYRLGIPIRNFSASTINISSPRSVRSDRNAAYCSATYGCSAQVLINME